MLAPKQWFHLLRGPQQVHVHTDHEALRYLKTCARPLTPPQVRWSQFHEEYNLTLWYVPGLENPAAEACSRLTSRLLMDIEYAAHTRHFVVHLVENWVSPEGEPVDYFPNVLEDTLSHDEVWLQPYDHLYVSLPSGCSAGKDPDAGPDTGPAPQSDTEPADGLEELEPYPLPTNEVATEDLHKPATHLDDAGIEIPGQSVDPDDLPEMDMDRPF